MGTTGLLLFSALAFCTAALSGCTAVRYEANPVAPEHSAAEFASRRLNSRVSRWSERALVHETMAGHPNVLLAKAKVATASAAVGTAGTKPNPTVGFQPDIAANPGDAVSPWALGFTLDVPVETAGKRARRVDVAHAALQAASLDAATVIFQTADAVRKAFRDLAAAAERAALLARQQNAQEEVVKLFDARVQAGDLARAETTQSRLLLQQTRLAARDAEKKQAEARAALAAAAGVPVEAVTMRRSTSPRSIKRPGAPRPARPAATRCRTGPTCLAHSPPMPVPKPPCGWRSPNSILTSIFRRAISTTRVRTSGRCLASPRRCRSLTGTAAPLWRPSPNAPRPPPPSSHCSRRSREKWTTHSLR